MKIAHISYYYQPIVGGQEVYIDNLINVLNSKGVESKVFQSSRRGKKVNNRLVTSIHIIPFFPKRWGNWDWHIFTLSLFFYRNKILVNDVIISHYAMHSIPFWNYPEKLIILSHGVEWSVEKPKIEDRLRRFIAKKTLNRFVVVANDTHYYRELGYKVMPGVDYFREILPGKWFIPNCVDVNVFRRNDGIQQLKERKIILVPRQICHDRGIHLAIKAFHIFLQSHSDYYLYIIGTPKSGEYYFECLKIVDELNINQKVNFIGFVEHKQMPLYYSSSEICLIPTLSREGTSLSALEAMSCGTPTVSTNVAGLKDLPTIQSEPTEDDLAKKMIETIANREEISKIQKEKVQRVFNMHNWGNAWMNVIESLIKNNPHNGNC